MTESAASPPDILGSEVNSMAEKKDPLKTYNVECKDGTEGRVSARSSDEADDRGAEMCKVHDGLKERPQGRQ